MPINYEPPAPVAPATSAAYGMAQQYSQDAPTILGYRQQNLQAGIAGAQAYNAGQQDVTQRSIAAGQQNTQLEALHQSQLFQAAQEQNRAQQQAQMQYAQQEQQAAELRSQQIQQQQMLRQHYDEEFNQADRMELARHQQGDAWIRQAVAEGKIDQETATSLSATNHRLMDPLVAKKLKSESAYRDAEAKNLQAQTALRTQTELDRAGRAAQTVDQRTVPTYNPSVKARILAEMGPRPDSPMDMLGKLYDKEFQKRLDADPDAVHHWTYTDLDGKTHITTPDRTKAGTEMADVERAKAHWQASYKKAEAIITAEIKRASKEPDVGAANLQWWQQPGKREEAIANLMQPNVGARSLEEYLAGTLTGKYKPPHIAGSAFGSSVNPPGATPNAVAGQTDAGPKPFNPREPKTQTGIQRDQVEYADKGAQEIWERPDLPQPVREAAVNHLNHAKRLLAEYGSFGKMPDKAKAEFLTAKRVIESLPPPPAKPQAAKPTSQAAPPVQPDTYAPFSY